MLPEGTEVEDAPVELQRMWNLARARSVGAPCLSETLDTLETFEPAEESSISKQIPTFSDGESDAEEYQELVPQRYKKCGQDQLVLDATSLGDLPVVYRITPVLPHQLPVIGVYIDPRVAVGFRYRVKPLDSSRYLFDGKSLTLNSIGRGYARRFTFESSSHNDNSNYFWSDSRPEGFSFEIDVISSGDKFTIFDSNDEVQGTMEVLQIKGDQLELEQNFLDDRSLEKKVHIQALCKTEWYENGGETPVILITGVVLLNKTNKQPKANVVKIFDVTIGVKSKKKGYELRPGVQSSLRRTTVVGRLIGDAPTKYTIVGLEHYELPVIGTYIDPKIIPGFHYRVRVAGKKRYFFQGRSMLLQSIGVGYGKRISFAPENLNEPENYFWSDSHPGGLGFETRGVHEGMRFEIIANGEHLGDASVFRADAPQIEDRTELIKLPGEKKMAVDKHIHIDVTCHVILATTGGGLVDSEVHIMRVSGMALVRKNPNSNKARLIKVYNVGLDSQLNQLFVQSQTELTFQLIN